MRRAVIATVGTAAGLAALLSYKSAGPHKLQAVSIGSLGARSSQSQSTTTTPTTTGRVAPSTTSTSPPTTARTSRNSSTASTARPATTAPVTRTSPTSTTASARPASSTASTARPATTAPVTRTSPATTAAEAHTYAGADVQYNYGDIQVAVTVEAGRMTNISIPENGAVDARSEAINSYAVPILQQEALSAQGINIDVVSGATFTSDAFAQALQSALQKAGR